MKPSTSNLLIMLFLSLFSLLSFVACEQSVEEGEISDTYEVTIDYNGKESVIDAAKLETTEFKGEKVVALSTILIEAGISNYESLYYDFSAEDNYRPSTADNCLEVVPLKGDVISKGYLLLSAHKLLWDDSLNYPTCLNVKQFNKIFASDTSDMSSSYKVRIVHYSHVRYVWLNQVELEDKNGTKLAPLTKVVEKGGVTESLDSLLANFASKNFSRPGDDLECADKLPIDGQSLTKGYIDPEKESLVWDSSLNYPDCMNASKLAEIILTDKNAEPYKVKVTYNGKSDDIDVETLDKDVFEGAPMVQLVKIIEAAKLGKDATELHYDFKALDGKHSSQQIGCKDIAPVNHNTLLQGYFALETHRLRWEESLEFPSCLQLKGLQEIIVTDK